MEHERLKKTPSGVFVFWPPELTHMTTLHDPIWHYVGIALVPLQQGK
jgi:hypothetical protein